MTLIQQIRQLFHYYVVFNKSILFILGLIFSYKLVEKTFLNIFITHLTAAWGKNAYDLRKATMVVNLQEGTSAVSVLLFVYIADFHIGRFKIVVFATVFCIAGLFLNFLAARKEGDDQQVNLGLFYPALVLITFAQAALTVPLEAFLDDQLWLTGVSKDQRQRATKFWWRLVSTVAAIFSLFGIMLLEFRILVAVLAAVMGLCFLVFLLGTKCYHHVEKMDDQFKYVGIVVTRAIRNMNVKYPQGSGQGATQIPPNVPCLRWLDKAAIPHGTETGGCSDAQVTAVKQLFKMLPLWSCFLTLSLVAASGSTFFFEEASIVDDSKIPILFFTYVVRFTYFVVYELSSYIIRKICERMKFNQQQMIFNQQRMELVRIGMGMSCTVLCCIVSWWTTTLMRKYSINVYWLTPQYILLGIMHGLSQGGMELFYESQVNESLSSFGPPFGDLVMGVGKFMSILVVLTLSMTQFGWFQKDVNDSRLDKYYIFLAVLSFLNFMLYCLAAWWYRSDAFLQREDEEMSVIIAEQSDALINSVASRSDKGNGSVCGDATVDRSGTGEEGEADTHEDPVLGISHLSVSKPGESSCGEITADGEEGDAETHEDPLLGLSVQSTRNTTVNIYALIRVVTAISRLFSRARLSSQGRLADDPTQKML